MQDKFFVEEGARAGLRQGRIGLKGRVPKSERVPRPHALVVPCFVSALSARVKGDGNGGPSRARCAPCM